MINLKERLATIPAHANVTKWADALTFWFLENDTPDEVSSEGLKPLYDGYLRNGGTEGQWCIPNDLVLVYLFQLNNTRVWQIKQFKSAKRFNGTIEKICQTYGVENTKKFLAKEDKKGLK